MLEIMTASLWASARLISLIPVVVAILATAILVVLTTREQGQSVAAM